MYCVLAAARRGLAAVLQPQIRTVKSTSFVEITQSTILLDFLFSGNKPQNLRYDWHITIFKNKRRTYGEVNRIKNQKYLDFFISVS